MKFLHPVEISSLYRSYSKKIYSLAGLLPKQVASSQLTNSILHLAIPHQISDQCTIVNHTWSISSILRP
ncbi:hypothetical protein ACHQM5_005550 [Ranunculus cassubicifolius]